MDAEMNIRAVRQEEVEEALCVLCTAFNLSVEAARPIFYADPFYDLTHKRRFRTDAHGIVSCLTVVPSRIQVGTAWVPLGGIAGVATQPKLCGQGFATRLLESTVGTLADELHYPVSGLFAHAEGFYRRLGWEVASDSRRRSVPLELLPHKTQHTRAAAQNDFAAIHALHAAPAKIQTGDCRRDERRWHIIQAAANRECIVVYPPGSREIMGYMFWERQRDVLHLLELRAATPWAQEQLLGSLIQHQKWMTRLEWTVSEADWNASPFSLYKGECTSDPGLMLRLTNLHAALAAIHAADLAPILAKAGRTLTLRATDFLYFPNNQPQRLTPLGVVPGQNDDLDWIAGDIRAFAPFYLGFRTPSELYETGEITTSSPEALALADLLFPRRNPFVSPLDQF